MTNAEHLSAVDALGMMESYVESIGYIVEDIEDAAVGAMVQKRIHALTTAVNVLLNAINKETAKCLGSLKVTETE